MSNPTRQFGRLPYDIVDRGALIHLGATELRVYCALLIGANAKNKVMASQATLARRAGCAERTVRRTIPKLSDKGFVTVSAGGGRGRSSVYTVNENPDTLGVPLCEPKTRTPKVSTFPDPKPGQNDPETRTNEHLNPDNLDPKPGHPGCPPYRLTESTEQQRPASPAAAEDDSARRNQAIAELTRAGVGDPTRAKLADNPAVTARMVKRIRDASPAAGPGLIVQQIRAEVDKAEQRGLDKAERHQREQAREQARADALAALERDAEQDAEDNRAEVTAWWDGLDEQGKRQWGNSAIPSPHPARKSMSGEDIGSCPEAGRSLALRYLAWARWREVTAWRTAKEGAA